MVAWDVLWFTTLEEDCSFSSSTVAFRTLMETGLVKPRHVESTEPGEGFPDVAFLYEVSVELT